MSILSLDYGTKHIGLAISDETLSIAVPLDPLQAEPFGKFIGKLKETIRQFEVSLIIVGLPRNMDGSYGIAAEKVKQFVFKLRQWIQIPVEFQDERLSTKLADRLLTEKGCHGKEKKRRIDSCAAAVVLQSYLDGLLLKEKKVRSVV
ncbi:RNase H [Methylacidiphilum kamchatkense Kam1]|uniref:Putative pre-16S rRNA nuclease n=1 Tax=Methylacidiphilum kamchatkense Kam1 TaxID=1202785 RepID=A0A0C1RK86_9BACT|nr:Holliday junction resolvase RuvX [Methylacidiphilum kamchatkense]KIE58462.1 RNase H [Methylacidiphilum kamchatkense Kam1]QDQ43278.1 putative Holliday junction resolvase [Methylacidiphilum kamchatkense Kam1]